MSVEQEAVLAMLPPLAGCRVLDAGCGTGRYVRLLEPLGARMVGVDLSAAMLARARERGSRLARADLRALPLAAACCDVVVCGLAVIDLPDLGHVVREWSRVLTAGGVVVCSTLHPDGARLGWKRTFTAGAGLHVLPAHWHTADECRAACAAAGLVLDEVREPPLEPGGQPVALVVRARREPR